MTRQFLILLCSAICCTAISNAQKFKDSNPFEFESENNVQFEALGSGIFYSIIYEHVLINRGRFKTTSNLGGAIYGEEANVMATYLAHCSLNQLYSISPNHHIELGAGVMGYRENLSDAGVEFREREFSYMLTARLGYRYQKPDGNFLVRVAVTPIYEGGAAIYDSSTIHPWPAVAIGYSF